MQVAAPKPTRARCLECAILPGSITFSREKKKMRRGRYLGLDVRYQIIPASTLDMAMANSAQPLAIDRRVTT